MIRLLKDQAFVPGKNYIEAAGLSTDQKPTTGIVTGSRFLEVNTGAIYEFDEVSVTWSKVEDFDGSITAAVDAWLTAHPEATTTVQDGAISYAKLNSELKATADEVPNLKSAMEDIHGAEIISFTLGRIATSGNTVDITAIEASDATEYAVVATSEGELFTINGYGRNTYRLWCFVDAQGNNVGMSNENATATNLVIQAPADSAYLVLQNRLNYAGTYDGACFRGVSAMKGITDNESAIAETNAEIEEIKNQLIAYVQPSGQMVSGKLLNVNTLEEYTLTGACYFDFVLSQNEIIYTAKISGTSQGSNSNYPILCFLNSNNEIIQKFGAKSTEYTNEIVPVPNGTKRIIYNASTITTNLFAIGKIVASSEASATNKIYYSLNNNDLFVSTRYSATKDFVVELKEKGGNNLVDFGYLYTNNNTEDYPSNNLTGITSILSQGSDWHGPMTVRAVNNADGDNVNSHNWTGGNHQYNNTGSGSTATARCINIKWYADGNEITQGAGYCSNIKATWLNMVQGYNTAKADGTGREILAEYHELCFDGEKWETFVNIVALEDVVFERYYGLQHGGGGSIYPKTRYVGAVNRGEYTANDGSDSGDNKCYKMLSYGTEHEVDMVLDPLLDLGTFEHLTGTPSMLSTSYGKSYTNVIADTSATDWLTSYPVSAGDMISLHGWYIFKPTQFVNP